MHSKVISTSVHLLKELAAQFPRQHVYLAGALALVIGGLTMTDGGESAAQVETAATQTQPIANSQQGEPSQPGSQANASPVVSADATSEHPATAQAAAPAPQVAEASTARPMAGAVPLDAASSSVFSTLDNALALAVSLPPLAGSTQNDLTQMDSRAWVVQMIKPGDNLARLFQRAGADSSELATLLDACNDCKWLRRLAPGNSIEFAFNTDGALDSLRYQTSPLETTVVERAGDSFETKKVVREPETALQYQQAVIESSLYLAGKRAGLPQPMILEMANIFGGVIDFVMDPRRGDTFSLMYEEKSIDGKTVGTGNILAAQFVNQGQVYTAYRYVDRQGNAGYYNEKGESMRRAFLRAPLDVTRVTSGFNMNRFHPILKTVRPHRGIDYGAPTGTPVYASGDGRVVTSEKKGANGNYVVLSHNGQYSTKYLHLSSRTVRAGQKVKQGQLIGYVGCTGLCSGAHLHYEFLIDGVHRDPRKVLNKLAINTKLPKQEMARFAAHIRGTQQQLASLQQASALASARPSSQGG